MRARGRGEGVRELAAYSGIDTFDGAQWTVAELAAAKRGRRVSVVLPALDEERTVAEVIASILPLTTAEGSQLVDELVVVDSGSSDSTREVARDAGARVVGVEEILSGLGEEMGPRPGKGEALWRSLAATSGDIIAFVDTDLRDPSPGFVPGVVGPLLLSQRPVLVKGYYRRPFVGDGSTDPFGGGRVNELVAKPLLASFVPELAELRQPLAGEYAIRRDFAESVPFAAEYGVEIGLVLDAVRLYGPEGIAQVDLGSREHRHRSLQSLAHTSRHVIETFARRRGLPLAEDVLAPDRPPMREVRAPGAGTTGAPTRPPGSVATG